MHILGKVVFVTVALVSLESIPQAQEPIPQAEEMHSHNMAVHVGARFLDDDQFWEPLDEPFLFGFQYDWRSPSGFGVEVGPFLAFDSEDDLAGTSVDVDLAFVEVDFGVRYTFDVGRFHPYVGAGGAVVFADVTFETGGLEASEDDVAFGGYAHAGAYFVIGRGFTLGVDARTLFGTELDLESFVETDVDYFQIAATIGWTI